MSLLFMLTVAGCLGTTTNVYEVKTPTFKDYRNTSTTAPPNTTTSTAPTTSTSTSLSNSPSGETSSTTSDNAVRLVSSTTTTVAETRVVDMGDVVPSLAPPPNTASDNDIPDMVCLSRATIKKVLNLRPPMEGPGQGPWFEAKREIIEIEGLKSTKFFEGPSRIAFYYSQFNTTMNKTTGSVVNSSLVNPETKIILVNGTTPDPNAVYYWNSTINKTVIRWDVLKNGTRLTTTTTLSG